MVEGNIRQEFRLKKIDETKNKFSQEIEQNKLISRKYKMVCAALNYTEHFLIVDSAINECILVSAYTSLLVFLWDLRVLQ